MLIWFLNCLAFLQFSDYKGKISGFSYLLYCQIRTNSESVNSYLYQNYHKKDSGTSVRRVGSTDHWLVQIINQHNQLSLKTDLNFFGGFCVCHFHIEEAWATNILLKLLIHFNQFAT